jgi:catechol 2,3-dioxygenase-like lactoylglutathione lyase family enzyme
MSTPSYSLPACSIVMLGTSDVHKNVPYYRDQLGLRLTQQFEGFAFFDAGKITLMLSEPLAKASQHVAGATEVVFMVEDVRAAHGTLFN